MNEPPAMESVESRFARRVRAYTDPATERQVDVLDVARTALASARESGWSRRRLGLGPRGRNASSLPAAAAAVVLVGVVGLAVLGRPSDTVTGTRSSPASSTASGPVPSAIGPIPMVLRHPWQRPLPVLPGLDQWQTGFLRLGSERADYGPVPNAAASESAVMAAGLDTVVITATLGTAECATGDNGTYRWSVEGKGTVMMLTSIGADACPTREAALAGQWVRSDLAPPADGGVALPPGSYLTSAFDPLGAPGLVGQLSYTVPDGWKVKEDQSGSFLLHHLPAVSSSLPSTDGFVAVFAQPRLASDVADGAICGPYGVAPGVGHRVDDMVAAITARPGVVSTSPATVTVGGFKGRLLDLHVAPNWSSGCLAPEGLAVEVPIVVGAASRPGPGVGISPDHPARLILLGLADDRTLAVAIFTMEPSQSARFAEQVGAAMPVIESFEFARPTP
ncbi:MAG: hypothetical protein ABIZ72_06100 [Candidatus Limnocylindrales bacterium]